MRYIPVSGAARGGTGVDRTAGSGLLVDAAGEQDRLRREKLLDDGRWELDCKSFESDSIGRGIERRAGSMLR